MSANMFGTNVFIERTGVVDLQIRKVLIFIDETWIEAGRRAGEPLRKVATVAVVTNRLAGDWTESLDEYIEESAELGRLMAGNAMRAMAPYTVESYGKGAIVGLSGEQEHGVALLTTVFGDVLRQAVGGGRAWISSATKRAQAGATIDIPLAHKEALYVRSHYDAMTITLPDAPDADEIAVICCIANGGRLNSRVGGLAKDEITGKDGLT